MYTGKKYFLTPGEMLVSSFENIVDNYIGLLVVSEKITVLDDAWDVKYRDRLQGVIAFTKWHIPQKEAFFECKELTFILGVSPILGPDMSHMFSTAAEFDHPIGHWDTSSVLNMSYMFLCAFSFNQRLNSWDTSSVTNMKKMFSSARSFNRPLGEWNVTNVVDMDSMFSGAVKFDQPLGLVNC